jgi:hypothetical protein
MQEEHMRIRKRVEVEADVNLEIGVSDVAEAMHEAFAEANQGADPPPMAAIKYALNDIAIFLKGMSAENIAKLTPEAREIVRAFLTEQATRFEEEF